MAIQKEITIAQADRVLVWLEVLTIFLGGMATLAVVFLADVMTAKLANPSRVAGVVAVTMSEESELHHWIGYKVALAAMDDKDVVYHIAKAMSLATEAQQKSALDGVLVEHMPAGHFIHTKNILKELLGTKQQPAPPPAQLEARLALLLIKENRMDKAQEQLEHMLTVATGADKEVMQKVIKAMQQGDMEDAGRSLTRLSGG